MSFSYIQRRSQEIANSSIREFAIEECDISIEQVEFSDRERASNFDVKLEISQNKGLYDRKPMNETIIGKIATNYKSLD